MREIFTGLYNKVLGFFQKQEENEHKENAKDVAYNRLKLVLMQDRTNLTPLLLEKMRGEMIEVLSKYVEMDKDALELNFEQEGDSMALMLSIPVLRAKDEEEIQAALKEKEEADNDEKNEESDDNKDISDEDICAQCDCEYKDANIPCEECPKLETCECVEDVCAQCDSEYKDSDIECKDCEKASSCECKKDFDEKEIKEEKFKEEAKEETCNCDSAKKGEECTCKQEKTNETKNIQNNKSNKKNKNKK